MARRKTTKQKQTQRQSVVVNVNQRGPRKAAAKQVQSRTKGLPKPVAQSFSPVVIHSGWSGHQLLPPRIAEPDREKTSLLIAGFKALDARLDRLYGRVDETGDRVLDAHDRAARTARADSEFMRDAMLSAMKSAAASAGSARRAAEDIEEWMESLATGDPSLTKPGGSGRLEDLPEVPVADKRSDAELLRLWKTARKIEIGSTKVQPDLRGLDKAVDKAYNKELRDKAPDERRAAIIADLERLGGAGLIVERAAIEKGPAYHGARAAAAAAAAAGKSPFDAIRPVVPPYSGPFSALPRRLAPASPGVFGREGMSFDFGSRSGLLSDISESSADEATLPSLEDVSE